AANAAPHMLQDFWRTRIKAVAPQHADAGIDARERVTQVVTEHRNELLTQFGRGLLRSQTAFGLVPCFHQLTFVAAAFGCLEYSEAREKKTAILIPALKCVGEDGELPAVGRHQIERYFVEETL